MLVDAGFITIYWYGMMYLFAFVAFYILGRVRSGPETVITEPSMVSDLLFYGGIGVILGGRLGYCLFYGLDRLLEQPIWLFQIWEGGMSFHGGLIGVLVATLLWARLREIPFLAVTDFVAPLVPIGLGLGRIGNFINTELPGRVTDFVLGVHFPCSAVRDHNFLCVDQWEPVMRHMSSLYQAVAEGVILFVIVWVFSKQPRRMGLVSGVFLITAGFLRLVTEMFRQPDPEIGFILFETVTMGQLLSLPVILGGTLLLQTQTRRLLSLDE